MTDEVVSNKKLSRRQFVEVAAGGAAVLGAGAVLAPKLASALGNASKPLQASIVNPQLSLSPTDGSWVAPSSWDLSADVVVIGSGAAGMPAALAAAAAGSSVIVVEANYDVGGHSIISGGNVPLGGGTSAQKAYGIVDSPDLLFQDLTDWTIVEVNGHPDYRYNDRGIMRAAANQSAPCFEFLVSMGVPFTDVYVANTPPDNSGAHATGNSAPRENHCTYSGSASLYSPNAAGGTTFIRPMEQSARNMGVRFLLNYHMDNIIRENQYSGSVLGVMATYTGGRIMPGSATPLQSYATAGNINTTQPTVYIQANKGVILATGGHTGQNDLAVNFRRMFDPRLGPEFQTGGEPYSYQDASGEVAALKVGGALWGLANQTWEISGPFRTAGVIGARYNYGKWNTTSPIFPICGGAGLSVSNWQDAIVVNQCGNRIWNEMQMGDYPNGNYAGLVTNYVPNSYLNTQYITSSTPVTPSPYNTLAGNFVDAASAMNAGSRAPNWTSGPCWAIFDSAAVTREGWTVTYPNVDTANGYFFSASTLSALANEINSNPYQNYVLTGAELQATITRYNSFVTSGTDTDFGKPKPAYPISAPPYYAAWFTPCSHDSHSGIRINPDCNVVDLWGNPIPKLFCAGESAGGYNQHGNGRCACLGYIAGNVAAGVQLNVTTSPKSS